LFEDLGDTTLIYLARVSQEGKPPSLSIMEGLVEVFNMRWKQVYKTMAKVQETADVIRRHTFGTLTECYEPNAKQSPYRITTLKKQHIEGRGVLEGLVM